jgi:ABC-type bacteriocin/lantibiotic exporter with double-glycine peptidase domain
MTSYRKRAPSTCRRAKGLFFFLLAVVLTTIISGCASKNFSTLRPGIELRGHYIDGVPFYQQKDSYCGPAALASVLGFWGRPASLEQITAAVYLPELRGTLPMDMENFMLEAGFKTIASTGTLEELKVRIRTGLPVICLLDLGFGPYRQPHYVTVIGFDDANAVIIAHDGLKANNVIGYKTFENEWTRAGHWMLIADPKSSKDIP